MELINIIDKYSEYLPKNYKVDYVMLDVYNNINVIYYKNYDRNKSVITDMIKDLNIYSINRLNNELAKYGYYTTCHYFDRHLYFQEIISLKEFIKNGGVVKSEN